MISLCARRKTIDIPTDQLYNTLMNTPTLKSAPSLNQFEAILVAEYMEKKHPKVQYTMMPGNKCIRVHYNFVTLYFIFHNGALVDVQQD